MRIKLDENLPEDARLAAVGLGHDVDTVVNEGIGGVSDRDVFVAAIREGRFLITLDRGFGDIRHYPPGSHPGIAVIRVESQDPPSVVLAWTPTLGSGANATAGWGVQPKASLSLRPCHQGTAMSVSASPASRR